MRKIVKINNPDNEALKTLTMNTAQFPQAAACIRSMPQEPKTAVRLRSCAANAPEQPNTQEDAVLEVIWAGRHDAKNHRVICQLTSKDESVLNSYYAKVVDQAGTVIAQDRFVSFDQDIAFANLIVPKDIFETCSVRMDMAMVGRSVKTASKTIPLSDFDVKDLNAVFEIDAPKITRSGSYDKISISYYQSSSKANYDYVYPGRSSNQMYFPSGGRIVVDGVELKGASGRLTISDGKREVTCYKPLVMEAEDSVITYSFQEKWENTKLTDCFEVQRVFAKADYLLVIDAIDADMRVITFMVTNIASLIEQGDKDRVKEIQQIDVYLDCFAGGTEIGMADGSVKTVENVRPGDFISTPGGGRAAVSKVQEVEECQVLTFILQSGGRLSLTDGHAVCTKDGVFPAFRLRAGQEVITKEGTDKIVRVVPQCERLYTVYALFLEGEEQWLYANGVKVHSSDGGELFADRDWVREDLPEEWQRDYDNALKAGMLYGNKNSLQVEGKA